MSIFYPDYRFKKIWEIPGDFFVSRGITVLLLDADNTLREDNGPRMLPEARAWLEDQRERGLRLFIVSNNARNRSSAFAANCALEHIDLACKPFAYRVRRALRAAGEDPGHAAMVGDQVFTDILCGKNLGCLTVLVEPFTPENYGFFRIKRPLEALALRRYGGKEKQ